MSSARVELRSYASWITARGLQLLVGDVLRTQRETPGAIAAELAAAGFGEAEEIGRGGFAVVYRCIQAGLDRVVAVKVLTADLAEHRPRFVREQQAMGRLTGHPNIAAVLQVGETGSGHPYLVMPFFPCGCVHGLIRGSGVLAVEEVLRLGVKAAGALESAHRLGIVHRDVKPANIMLTDYGEPALIDFGIAHVSGGFKTAAGVFTGTPAFTAPEVLGGQAPSSASDVYGLGATLFTALTGHAAFERRSGEQVVAQFLRIASDALPDLRERGIPGDLSAVVEAAMAHDPRDRPSALLLGQQLQRLQADRDLVIDEMAVRGTPRSTGRSASGPAVSGRGRGLPAPLSGFVGRRTEIAALRDQLSTSRLVTLTGVGGIGKTTLALRVARELAGSVTDGVSLVELGELRDPLLLTEVAAAALGVRSHSARPLIDVLIEFLYPREALVVLDNCEHLIEASAQFAETVLTSCPGIRILATSREVLGVGGESVLALSPLPCPDIDTEPTLTGLADYDAVRLFVDRARAAVPGFALTDRNFAAVSQICSHLDGLPLALELAAARVRALSLRQIADGLADRYGLLTSGRRGAPQRQQTLATCVGWSFELCTPAEQQLWARLSVFAGSFDLDAARHVCGQSHTATEFVDLLSALVDKSVLIRVEHDDTVRYRFLETLRDYGAAHLQDTEQKSLQHRHGDWYAQLVDRAAAQWWTAHQLAWLRRLRHEMPNLRAALQFSLHHRPVIAIGLAAGLRTLWTTHGMLPEGQRWMDLALAATPDAPTPQRLRGLYQAGAFAVLSGDPATVERRIAEARHDPEVTTNPHWRGKFDALTGCAALLHGDLQAARESLLRSLQDSTDDAETHYVSTVMLGWAQECSGDSEQALRWFEKAVAIAQTDGDTVYTGQALESCAVGYWRIGQLHRAQQTLRQALLVWKRRDDPWNTAQAVEIAAWLVAAADRPRQAGVLMAAAAALSRALGSALIPWAEAGGFHHECERRIRDELGPEEFHAAWNEGAALSHDEAIDFALREDD
jgi:non-specific serine/threonine protein kinase